MTSRAHLDALSRGLALHHEALQTRDLSALRSALEAPDARAALATLRFAPLDWLSGPFNAEQRAFAAQWVHALATPPQMVAEIERRHKAQAPEAVFDVLLEGASDWLREGSLHAVVAQGNAIGSIVFDSPKNEPLNPTEIFLLERLLSCQPGMPIRTHHKTEVPLGPKETLKTVSFDSFLISLFVGMQHPNRTEGVADLLEKTFGAPALREAASADLLRERAQGHSCVHGLNSPWIQVAAARHWLDGPALQALFQSRMSTYTSGPSVVAKNIVDEWDGDQKVQARQVLLSFLSQGVDPNAVLDVPVSRSATARTSMLHLAIQAVQTDLVKLLLNHGADPMLKVHALDEQVHAKGRGKNAPSVLALEQRRASAQKTANPHAEWPPNRQELLNEIDVVLQAHQAKRTVNDLLASLDLAPRASAAP